MPSNRPAAIDVERPAFAERRERYFAASGQGFDVKAEEGSVQIDLYDEIGPYGASSKDFRAKLRDAGKRDIVLRINSPGGSVFDGIGIYADLIAHPGNIKVEIVGVAASVASIIAMAGDERLIAPESYLMIHNSWTLALGNESELLEIAALLKKIDTGFVATYSARTSIEPRAIKKMMAEETWLTGKEAVENGFATGLLPAADARAKFDLSIFAKAPDKLRDAVGATKPTNIRDFESFLRDEGGFSRSQAKALAAGGFSAVERRDDAELMDLARHIALRADSISQIH